jgi:NADP-dependent 3-hydroxy acid dehydrogenase YdfG
MRPLPPITTIFICLFIVAGAERFDFHNGSSIVMTQQVIPQMKKQNSGHVVSISGASVDQPSSAERALLAVRRSR